MPLRLLDLYTPRPTNDTISALFYSSDPDVGRVPAYWVLKNKVLSAVFTDAQFETINKAVVADSEVRFVTSDAASLRKQIAREWCAVRNPTNPTTGLPGYLSVKGSAEQFTYCTSFPVVGNPTQASIYYKAVVPSTGGDLERYCFKAHLVIQSIGIIAEPIPA
ncbi:hypothetical protein FRC19_005121 [Serendipita sp. 401]|nr:hypothetical protein FRC19_005121 [Serendipita sp. 401]KAG9032792.1 hypothetical protein FS842_004031 [Serendipita sp. 407]